MNLRKTVILALIALLLPAAVVVPRNTGFDSVHLRGSDSLLPAARLVAEEYMKENESVIVSVEGGGTLRGVKAVIDGTADIALSSDSGEEPEYGEVPLVSYPVARDCVVPVINASNRVSTLTPDQLRKIFSGEIRNWKSVGGADAAITVISHDGYSGTHEVWTRRIMGADCIITPRALILENGPLQRYIAHHPNAIGYIALTGLDKTVKPVAISGRSADAETLRNRSYPTARTLALRTLPDAPAHIKQFIRFFLDESKGGRIIRELGMIPSSGDARGPH